MFETDVAPHVRESQRLRGRGPVVKCRGPGVIKGKSLVERETSPIRGLI